MTEIISGVLCVDKPGGITSARVVRAISRLLDDTKCGHLGTLDPMATGLLVVLSGHALKTASYHVKGRKRYVAEIQFGSATDTCDAEGETIQEGEVPRDLHLRIEKALDHFHGTISQVPPQFSAVKVHGRRSYSEARKGKTVEIPPREVTFYRIDRTLRRPSSVVLDVTCSAGTYIRSLARDLGSRVKSPAHLSSLRRLESLPFNIDNAVPFEAMKAGSIDPRQHLHPIEKYLPPLPIVPLNEEETRLVRNGVRITREDDTRKEGPVLLMDPEERLVAIGDWKPDESRMHIRRVVRPV